MNALDVKKRIKAEYWVLTNPQDFKVDDFKALEVLAAKLDSDDEREDLRHMLEEGMQASTKPIIALCFLATIIGRHPLDDNYLLSIIEVFDEAKMDDVMEYLCYKALEYDEYDYVLKRLNALYTKTSQAAKRIEICKRIVMVDPDEIDMLVELGQHYQKAGDKQNALIFYRRAVQRYIKNHDFSGIKDLWARFLQLKPENTEYLSSIAVKVGQELGADRGVYFLNSILEQSFCDEDQKIEVLKEIIQFSSSDIQARDRLIEAYRLRYASNPRLESVIQSTGIKDSYQSLSLAIDKFETEIKFNEGSFVFHKTWGIGRIMKINKDDMDIAFITSRTKRTMTSNMAYSSLRVLDRNHIWVLKTAVPAERLKSKFQGEMEWGLRILIESFGGSATLKEMKAEICPSILSASEWTSWQSAARKELMQNPYFGPSETKVDAFSYRKTPLSLEEKVLNLFKAEKDFFPKVRIIREFLSNKANLEDDSFALMLSFFTGKAGYPTGSVESVCSYLFLKDVKKSVHFINIPDKAFMDYYRLIEDKVKLFEKIDDSELKKSFIDNLCDVEKDEAIPELLRRMFPLYLNSYIPDRLNSRKKTKGVMAQIMKSAVDDYRENGETLLYLKKSMSLAEWAKAGITEEKLLIGCLQLLAYSYRCIETKTEVPKYKKISTMLLESLFTVDNEALGFIERNGFAEASRIYPLIESISSLDGSIKVQAKHLVMTRFGSEADSLVKTQKKASEVKRNLIPTALLCTAASYARKTAELEHLVNVEIPENSKEIGRARELGDLRENSEYQYGKDRQKELNALMGTLNDEISKAKIVDPASVTNDRVGFGTKVTLHDNIEDKEVVYTIMGPWESDPLNNIISFKTPVGSALYNLEIGQTAKFNIGDLERDMTVTGIDIVEF
jgi:transcription elongation factor GreA